MSKTSTFKMKFKRRMKGKTDYSKRLGLLKSKKPRLVVRKSNNNVLTQIIEYSSSGDKVLVSGHSKELKKLGWKMHKGNIPAAYLTGMLCGLRAKKKNVSEAVLDIGRLTPVHGSVVFAVLKGVVDAGISIPFDEKAFPSQERVSGKEIQKYLSSLSEEEKKKRFPAYVKEGIEGKIAEHYEETLKKVKAIGERK
ncbi:50S ribosomal protein L18 [Candidatus Micrarchaeota archaeon]|nr:50S ribosomal protein L18 [Candidatus Micrarchaeota archaeon]